MKAFLLRIVKAAIHAVFSEIGNIFSECVCAFVTRRE
jgi:hypothetical protein